MRPNKDYLINLHNESGVLNMVCETHIAKITLKLVRDNKTDSCKGN